MHPHWLNVTSFSSAPFSLPLINVIYCEVFPKYPFTENCSIIKKNINKIIKTQKCALDDDKGARLSLGVAN